MRVVETLFLPGEILDSKGIESFAVKDLTLNSGDAREGSLFFAVRGTSVDSHTFVPQVLAKGAAVVVEDPQAFEVAERAVLVASTRAILGKVADRFWGKPSSKFSVVAVTGTNGKTTTTHLLEQAWTLAGKVSGMIGTIRYQVGPHSFSAPLTTPDALSLQKLWAEMAQVHVEYAAMEASSIALDQGRVNGTKVRAAVFTNLTQDHLDYHHTMEEYFLSKRKLFLDFHPEIAVIGVDDAWGQRLWGESTSPKKYRFSVTGNEAEFQLLSYEVGAEAVLARVRCMGEVHQIETKLLGRHNIANLLSAAATLVGLGWSVDQALKILSHCPGAPGRLERVGQPGGCEVLVDYAHSDDALEQVLKSLEAVRDARKGRIITVFGCGGDRDKLKRPKMARVVSLLSDITVATSDNPRTEDPSSIIDDIEVGILSDRTQYVREVDRRSAIHAALRLARPEDVLLIAGKGHETYQIIGKEKLPFDDREVVREYFQVCSPMSV
jgi:UDP-N-acetylmuramoyl-L-alanyl-D-glutamate--2,6-diaminopimelate ligase